LAIIGELDGGSVNIAIDRELKRLARDIFDRPNSKKKRTVKLVIHGIGIADDQGFIRKVEFEVEVVPTKIPNYITVPISAKATMNGLEVDLDDPEGVNQKSIHQAIAN